MSVPTGPSSSSAGASDETEAPSWASSPLSTSAASTSMTPSESTNASTATTLSTPSSEHASPKTATIISHSPTAADKAASPDSVGVCWNELDPSAKHILAAWTGTTPHDPVSPEEPCAQGLSDAWSKAAREAPGQQLFESLGAATDNEASAQQLFDECRFPACLRKHLEELQALRSDEAAAPDCPAIITALNDIGLVLDRLGMYGQALKNFDEAYKLAMGLYGAQDKLVAATLVNSGNTLCKQGYYDEALQVLREALRVNRAALGDEHEEVANTLNSIGAVLEYQGKRSVALERYRVALTILRRLHPASGGGGGEGGHPDVAMVLENIASVLADEGTPHAALRSLEEALRIRSGCQCADHEDIAHNLCSTGSALLQAGDAEGALRRCRDAHRILHRVHGGRHEGTAAALVGAGNALVALGRQGEALAAYEEAMCILHATVGHAHPHTATAARNIGSVLVLQKRYREAAELLGTALVALLGRLDCEHVEVAHTQYLLALACSGLGELDRAKGLFHKCSKIYLKEYGVESSRFKFSIDSFLSLAASGESLLVLPSGEGGEEADASAGWVVEKFP